MRMRRLLATVLGLLLVCALPALAQMRGGHVSVRFGGGVVVGRGFSGHGVGVRGGFAVGHNARFGVVVGSRRVFHRPVFFRRPFLSIGFGYPIYGYPYTFAPYYYDNLYYSSYAYPPPPPPAAYYSDDNSSLADEVYRLRSEVAQLRAEQDRDQQERTAAAPPPVPRPPSARTNETSAPSIVLVFRDGHRSEVRNYAIVGQTLWMFSEDQAKKVPLSSLDVDATTKANEQRGIEFRMPASGQTPR